MKNTLSIFIALFSYVGILSAQQTNFTSGSATVQSTEVSKIYDKNKSSYWFLTKNDQKTNQQLTLTLTKPGDVSELTILTNMAQKELSIHNLQLFISYDPMNMGDPINYKVSKNGADYVLKFPPRYGAHLQLVFEGNSFNDLVKIFELSIGYEQKSDDVHDTFKLEEQPWMDASRSVEKRVTLLINSMSQEDKMELLREGWGIPGIPRLGIPFINKVEAIHGYSYGSGATIFPQSIGLGATWDKALVEKVSGIIGDETVSAHTIQAWSPVLDVAQDARWGRVEETYGEDPVLVTKIGSAWVKGFKSRGLFVTPKHFAAHGAPLGGRDSHDIGLSEREMREIHLVPFREIIQKYDVQSIMEAYSDYLGVPVAKSKELLQGILREEWGFDGFIVSDCGAVGNLTARKHYTAEDYIVAANQALEAGIATNCGDVYNNSAVIQAAKDGRLNQEALDNTCKTILRTMFRNGLFENNPSEPLDWDIIYPGWNSAEHKAVAREAARKSIVMLKNKNAVLPLSKSLKKIAVIGPGADDLQPGDYTAKLQPGQLKSVLYGIKESVDENTNVIFEKGCEFFDTKNSDIQAAVKAVRTSDVAVLVLGDCSTSEASKGVTKTSGEANDYASLILPGDQQKLLEAVCATGKPVILILQSGRPYNLSFAKEHCNAILVNWLPGQEGGPATADVLFGDYNPSGKLPMTFPKSVAQLPLYYNFKTSGRGYNYVDMDFYPLYRFGYGLSYTHFTYSNLKTEVLANGSISVNIDITNSGPIDGEEVVQLYITDMFASVKTRVLELKDFEKVMLKPKQTKAIKFILSPYALSLLNDKMDRVVEKGAFKVSVGGVSPRYKAGNNIKESVGYGSDNEGLTSIVEYGQSFKADFHIELQKSQEATENNIAYKIVNLGNITDTDKLKLYVNGKEYTSQNIELAAGEEKIVKFKLPQILIKDVIVTSKYKSLSTSL
ncbi:glycoside hydrolase family 3 C-terminal domain-containing protein [Galbibacter pacificus]|uniref:Glycoside hydrolase family 3 C-terminal domain-containing protein n=1 Tax=Galbibacter pacificus TaxID=2996052 RepID=A0ABT6FMQ8_9FLAO|nr:glycoside hydrolase family 3 C-terminal domain-containing protein [Galbibacter pacificus]MDG3581069.1 glycoside hydrolase family 3 C-terminal domain-containing protein [Galbibacter pacificus]MDG3584547.1 glycoside hydrolase family 3 C-terminal domain-containing protein [Galbibacter pacificus]